LRNLQKQRIERRNKIKLVEKGEKIRRERLQKNVERVMKKFLPDVDLKIKKGKKAIWSYTEKEVEEMEEERENEVIRFMDELDFDEMIGEIEVG
jgi:hypothetical protein